MYEDDILSALLGISGGVLFFWLAESFAIITGLPVMVYLVFYTVMACLMYFSLKIVLKEKGEGKYFCLSIIWTAISFIWLLSVAGYFFKKIKSS